MTLELDLQPDVEQHLVAVANQRGISVDDYVVEIVLREMQPPQVAGAIQAGRGFVDLCSRLHGFADDWIVTRDADPGRAADFS